MSGNQKDAVGKWRYLPSDIVWSYKPSTKSWSRNITTGDHPPQLYGACAVELEGKIILHGGDPFHDNLFVYDPKENEWMKEGGGKGRTAEACFVDKTTNKLHVFGGEDDDGFSNELQIHLNGTWQKQTDERGPTTRYRMAAATVGTAVFVHGGYGGEHLDDLWRLNLTNLKWEKILSKEEAAKPEARSYHSLSALSDDVLLLVGGFDGSWVSGPYLTEVWTYRISSNEWKRQEDLPAESFRYKVRGLAGHKAISLIGENGRPSVFITGGDIGRMPYHPEDIFEYYLVC
jgi:N-acetylneuraminic acid mutarotase